MANTLITILLAFNIILLLLYFMVKIHRHTVDRARKGHTLPVEEENMEG
jgi:hypothetical protein